MAGLVGPYIAAFAGPMHVPTADFVAAAVLALLIAFATASGAMVLRGLSCVADDDDPRTPPGSTR